MIEKISDKAALRYISLLSAAVVAFLFWYIYLRDSSSTSEHGFVNSLPLVNACLNGISATFVAFGIFFIKQGNKSSHAFCMVTATLSSALFLVSYLTYHYFHGDTKFPGQGLIRPVYFFILISHIITSVIALPLIFTTLFFAISKRFDKHKKVAAWTYPVWLYVSITGILVYVVLKHYVVKAVV